MTRRILDWEEKRRTSRNIADFAHNLKGAVMETPRPVRAELYANTLKDIDPVLESTVRSLTQMKIDRGVPADQALEEATSKSLLGRRKALFRHVFGTVAPGLAKKAVSDIIAFTPDPKYRAQLFNQMVESLRGPMPLSFDRKEAAYRLTELPFQRWFQKWALETPRLSKHDVAKLVQSLIEQGVPPREAMTQALTRAAREYALEYVMVSGGVASGPDFCVVATAVTAAIGAAVAVAGAAQRISSSVGESRAARRSLEHQKREPLTDIELQEFLPTVVSNPNWADVRQQLLEHVTAERQGRNWLLEDEESRFRELWRQGRIRLEQEQLDFAQAEIARQEELRQGQAATERASLLSTAEGALEQLEAQRRTEVRSSAWKIGLAMLLTGAIVYGGYELLRPSIS